MLIPLENFEDVIELEIEINEEINLDLLHWIQYNPRKIIRRYGCSITSLDGNDIGVPDLDSLREFNNLNRTNYREKDFKLPTKHAYPFKNFLETFVCGRSHYLKLDPGGFFPWHRDSDLECFRVIYTIKNCNTHSLVWIEDDRIIELQDHKWYYINTKKKHCLFAFDTAIMAVFNVLKSSNNLSKLMPYFKIK